MGSVPTPPQHHHVFSDSFSPKSPCIVDLLDFFDITDVGSFEKRILKWKEKFDAYLSHVIEEQIPSLILSSPQEQEVIEKLRDILTVTISSTLDEIKEKSATFVSDLLALQHQLPSDHKMLFTRIILEFSNFSRLVQSMGTSHPVCSLPCFSFFFSGSLSHKERKKKKGALSQHWESRHLLVRGGSQTGLEH